MERARVTPGLVCAVCAGAALRLPWLGAVPTPAGDEGNWALTALALSRGHEVALSADAGFVSLAFARMVALAFRVMGPSFTAARAVLVAGALAGVIAVHLASQRVVGRRGADAMALALALHPWAVAWGRTASVPYALGLPLAVLGVVALLRATRERSAWWMAAAFQCLGMGLHVSPLGVIPWAVAAGWVALPSQRWTLGRWTTWAAVGLGALHAAPMLRGVMAVPASARQGGAALSGEAVWSALRAMVGQLDGWATVNHFAGAPRWAEVVGAVVVAYPGLKSGAGLTLKPALRAGFARFHQGGGVDRDASASEKPSPREGLSVGPAPDFSPGLAARTLEVSVTRASVPRAEAHGTVGSSPQSGLSDGTVGVRTHPEGRVEERGGEDLCARGRARRNSEQPALGAGVTCVSLGCCRGSGEPQQTSAHRLPRLERTALAWMALALVALPLMLVPARAWSMPTIDSDRYGFVLIAPLVLLLGALASRARLAVGTVLAMFALGSVTMAAKLTVGGGQDQGLFTARNGGRYRGWMVPRERRPLAEMVREAVAREGGGVVAYDDYAFHVLRFVNAVAGDGRVTHALGRRDFPAGQRVFVLAWSPGVFAEGYEPAGVARWQLGWRDRYALDGLRRVRSWVQPDGSPLCELWVGVAREPGVDAGQGQSWPPVGTELTSPKDRAGLP